MLDPAVHAQLASILAPSALLTSAEETRPYECDGLTMYRELPAAVALPDNEAQLVEVLRRCHAAGVPVVARGAGTSLSGGALPNKLGVVVALAKFRHIVAIDPSRARRWSSPACAISRSRQPPRPSAFTTRPIPRRRSPARSAATSARTRAASIA
jgi:FAD/FMN-containing dehydrogenase